MPISKDSLPLHEEEKEKGEKRSNRLCVVETTLSIASKLIEVNWSQEPYQQLQNEAVERRLDEVSALKAEVIQMAENIDPEEYDQIYQDKLKYLQQFVDEDGLLPAGRTPEFQAHSLTRLRLREKIERYFFVQDRKNIRELITWFWTRLSELTHQEFVTRFEKIDIDDLHDPAYAESVFNQDQEVGLLINTGLVGVYFNDKKLYDGHMAHTTMLDQDNYQFLSDGFLSQPRLKSFNLNTMRVGMYEYSGKTGVNDENEAEQWNAVIVNRIN